ncbi:hypothetical protein JCM8097_000990 [Rhodosporidiobolus ruineniae]
MTTLRPLGYYERFSLARTQSGVAPTVAFTAVVDPTSPIEDATVHRAIAVLLARYPLLSCTVADRTTTKPRFARNDALEPNDILAALPSDSTKNAEVALLAALEAGQTIDLDKGPLWRVWINDVGEGCQRVTLAVNHCLSDGTGTRNLFSELLALLHSPVDVPTKEETLATSMEDTVDCTFGGLRLAKFVFSEVVLPNLPSFLRSLPPPVFPNPLAAAPAENPSALRLLSLPLAVVAGLKAAGKANGVPTLHPVLYTVATAALASTASAGASIPSLRIVGSTPFSLRDPSLHPTCTGNYVAGYTSTDALPALLSERFWAKAAAYGKTLADPATKAEAAHRMGTLSLVPDGEILAADGKEARTKWESWVEEQLEKGEYGESFEVSNLGVLPATGWEMDGKVEEVYWAQTASGWVASLQLNPVAVKNGALTFSVSYRKNAVPEETVERFWTTYEALLKKIADGQVGIEATFKELAGEQ